jgi:hypothetical protein
MPACSQSYPGIRPLKFTLMAESAASEADSDHNDTTELHFMRLRDVCALESGWDDVTLEADVMR